MDQPGRFSALPSASTYGWAVVTAFERLNIMERTIIMMVMMRRIAVIVMIMICLCDRIANVDKHSVCVFMYWQ